MNTITDIKEGDIVKYPHPHDGMVVRGKVIGVSRSATGTRFVYVNNWANRVLISDIFAPTAQVVVPVEYTTEITRG